MVDKNHEKMRLSDNENSKIAADRIVFFFAAIALVLVLVIIISLIGKRFDSRMTNFDEEQMLFAEKQAAIEFHESRKAFSLVFDSENKQFVDEKIARGKVKPYGTSKEHSGMYLLVDVDEEGNISSKWISP